MNPLKSGQATIDVSGMSRQYTLKVPDNYDANHPYRLIFSFHWLNGTMQNIANGSGTAKAYYGLWDLANGSTIFVAPQGISNGWSDTGRSSTKGGQDIQLTQALYDKITSSMCIDKTRVFSEGFSMGGSMSYAVACALPDLFRAVAVHSGGPMTGCVQHTKAVAYFMTHGINDSVCTYPGYGVPQINDFAKVNGCMTATLPTPSSAQASCIDFPGLHAGLSHARLYLRGRSHPLAAEREQHLGPRRNLEVHLAVLTFVHASRGKPCALTGLSPSA
jgi:poly(3-hydroxybutyrate) depolymerase